MSINSQTLTLILKKDMVSHCRNCKKEYDECKKCKVYVYINTLLNVIISRR